MKRIITLFIITTFFLASISLSSAKDKAYTVGVGDILEIRILRPDRMSDRSAVSPDGNISVAYIGSLRVKGKTITQIQKTIQKRLSAGYMKYPVVTVSLVESHSRNFTISGEINDPGTYPLGVNTTVLKAISIAGGFTRFGSSSRVKILRPRKNRPGYKSIKINLKAVMDGDDEADIIVQPGDIIVVSEGGFF